MERDSQVVGSMFASHGLTPMVFASRNELVVVFPFCYAPLCCGYENRGVLCLLVITMLQTFLFQCSWHSPYQFANGVRPTDQ